MNRYPKTNSYRILPNLLLLCFLIFFTSSALAQSNFEALEPGDVEEREAAVNYVPGLKVEGNYRLYGSQLNSGTLTESQKETYDLFFKHDLRLNFRSVVHRTASLNLEIAAQQASFEKGDIRRSPSADSGTTDSQETDIHARQAFLEYNSNPKNILRFGKQTINLGDRRGKVFSGILSGGSQTCTLGTWCYDLGAMKLGNHQADWLYYGSLDYPVFENGNREEGTLHRLNVEVFRMFYTERDIPAGKANVPTTRNQENWDDVAALFATGDLATRQTARTNIHQIVDQQGRPIYYDALNQEYFGLKLVWEFSDLLLQFDITANQGMRRYHLSTGNEDPVKPDFGADSDKFKSHNRSKQSIAGVASELEVGYQWNAHRFGFRWMSASGDRERRDDAHAGTNFLRALSGFYEIAPGSYRGTNLYFNGGDQNLNHGTGLGHSVNNTQLMGFKYDYTLEDIMAHYRLGLYQLSKNQPILNERGNRVKDIGVEWDNTFSWQLEKHVVLEGEINFLAPGGAFTYRDNEVPTRKNELIVQAVARIAYDF